jgi:hypothetical protein
MYFNQHENVRVEVQHDLPSDGSTAQSEAFHLTGEGDVDKTSCDVYMR